MPENRRYPQFILNREQFSGRCIQLTIRFGFKAAKLQDHLIDPAHFRITKSGLNEFVQFINDALTLLSGRYHAPRQRHDWLFHYLRQVHIALIRQLCDILGDIRNGVLIVEDL